MENLEKSNLIKLTEIIAVVPAVAIAIGVVYKISFYSSDEINALWLVSLFSPVDFMLAKLQVYVYYLGAALYISKVFDSGYSKITEFLVQLGSLAIIGAFFYFFKDIGGQVFLFTIASFIAFYLLFFHNIVAKVFGLMIIFFIPWYMGGNDSKVQKIENLPRAILEIPDSGSRWSLLDKYSDKAILIKKSNDKNNFKVVEIKDISYIQN
ncbi:hypothetical protein ACQP6V_08480 [Acinetobacter baumannii]|uniref:hypothetical protein n=1 Tax=Acinetobacter baumannii TaxID=470 RepID=UPI003CFC6D6E